MPDLEQNTYSAELFVASQFTYAGWNTYFPQRDKGFDFIASKEIDSGEILIRPVQVKGKYPEDGTTERSRYGYKSKPLSQVHEDMVIAIPFYRDQTSKYPEMVAYMPRVALKRNSNQDRCQPAKLTATGPQPRSYFKGFFGKRGLKILENPAWGHKSKEEYPWAG